MRKLWPQIALVLAGLFLFAAEGRSQEVDAAPAPPWAENLKEPDAPTERQTLFHLFHRVWEWEPDDKPTIWVRPEYILAWMQSSRLPPLVTTGPTTDAGKKQSRRNALKHGLAGSGLVLPLDDADAVFVPALDGGYALIGLRCAAPTLFSGMAWSTASVMADTRERLAAAGLSHIELPPVADIDEPADLVHLPPGWCSRSHGAGGSHEVARQRAMT